jgi:hypothetical protein
MKSSDQTVLKIHQISQAVSLLLEECEMRGITELVVERDLYWHVDLEASFELAEPKPDLQVGDIYEDALEVADIKEMIPGQAVLGLSQTASILNYLAYKLYKLV